MHAISAASSGVDDISALLKCKMPVYFLLEILKSRANNFK
jgi:hypothetical protein